MGDGLAGPAQTAQALHRQIHGALRGLPEDTARRILISHIRFHVFATAEVSHGSACSTQADAVENAMGAFLSEAVVSATRLRSDLHKALPSLVPSSLPFCVFVSVLG